MKKIIKLISATFLVSIIMSGCQQYNNPFPLIDNVSQKAILKKDPSLCLELPKDMPYRHEEVPDEIYSKDGQAICLQNYYRQFSNEVPDVTKTQAVNGL